MSQRLRVEELSKTFHGRRSWRTMRTPSVHAVNDVSLTIEPGQTLALVGESGCGKSTLVRTIAGIYQATAGRIFVDDTDISDRRALRRHRRAVQLVPQNPLSSLNRSRTIRHALTQPLRVHHIGTDQAEQDRRAGALLERVGLSADYLPRLPVGMSVGELQRVVVARALAIEPSILLLDEPTSSVDLTTKARIINLLLDVQRSFDLTCMIITHEIDIARHLSHQMAVMYLGRIVESGPTEEVFNRPRHPYTQMLVASATATEPLAGRRAGDTPLGEVPSIGSHTDGCAFSPRCVHAAEVCLTAPTLRVAGPDHQAACHRIEQIGIAAP
ncbi:ABC transporter ATP-binding protein [Solwaraspora sp. WMMD406]|uniref:oligopeptide/dipeptide ABC transporter ATP-binding protein n=1 Tax=Solwaraspora sp. WMMD406 TaxID=3016095 RepID=UPI0024179417|nr:ABC transporter ATP-binding protein [Solwaraspora sp. WMMD406]MDG4762530.1 ABC transporter ATP-binding protein [Solwaraspora sp. WMMD406]